MSEIRSSGKRKRSFFIVTAVLTGILGAFVLGEIALHFTRPIDLKPLTTPTLSANPMSGWAFVNPYCAYSPRPGYDKKLDKSVNRFGFISTPEIESVEKTPGKFRIAFLGGSSTAGTGTILSDKDTWPYRTWLALKKTFPGADIEFINAGVNGFTSFESLGRLWSYVRFFSPDIVVDYDGWNEMYYFDDASPERLLHREWKGDRDWKFDAVVVPARMKPAFPDRFLFWSQIYTTLRAAFGLPPPKRALGELGPQKRPDGRLSDSFDPRGIEVFRENLLMMKRICDIFGSEFFAVKQATLITPDLPKPLREERCFTWYHEFNYDAHVRAFAAIYRMIDENFPSDRVIDATRLSGNPDLLFDHTHQTPEGCDALGRIVAQALAQRSRALSGVK